MYIFWTSLSNQNIINKKKKKQAIYLLKIIQTRVQKAKPIQDFENSQYNKKKILSLILGAQCASNHLRF
jgi:hypothetical protein